MIEFVLPDGMKLHYEYDATQDMLYILLRQPLGASYYEDVPRMPGVMLRYDGETNKVVGLTVHNVQVKLMQRLIADLGEHVLPRAA